MDNYNFVQQGWQCPLCKRIYSPSTPCCFVCGEEGMTKTTTDIDTSKTPIKYSVNPSFYIPVNNGGTE